MANSSLSTEARPKLSVISPRRRRRQQRWIKELRIVVRWSMTGIECLEPLVLLPAGWDLLHQSEWFPGLGYPYSLWIYYCLFNVPFLTHSILMGNRRVVLIKSMVVIMQIVVISSLSLLLASGER